MDTDALAITIHYIQHTLNPRRSSPISTAAYYEPATVERCLTCEKFMTLKGSAAEIIHVPNPVIVERQRREEQRKNDELLRNTEIELEKHNQEKKYDVSTLFD